MTDFDPYWSIPKVVACIRKGHYDAEISFDQINYLIAERFQTRKAALAAANDIINPLVTKFHKDCKIVISGFKKAKP